jgi:hypothetical protein
MRGRGGDTAVAGGGSSMGKCFHALIPYRGEGNRRRRGPESKVRRLGTARLYWVPESGAAAAAAEGGSGATGWRWGEVTGIGPGGPANRLKAKAVQPSVQKRKKKRKTGRAGTWAEKKLGCQRGYKNGFCNSLLLI